jgi:class 3 adenylate cyclase
MAADTHDAGAGALPGGLVALLFTDLVGSTELLERLGDAAAEAVRRRHFGLLREAWHRGLMRVYARAGERGLALRQFHACRTILREQLGSDPSAETGALYEVR